MTASQEFCDYIVSDLLAELPNITSKKMFGGFGLYQEGLIFAIITSDDKVYFKVDEHNQKQFEGKGSKQFTYTFKNTGKTTTMPYWVLPEDILEDPKELPKWVASSVEVSKRAKK